MSSARHQHRDGFKPKLIALSVAACFSLSVQQSQANPTGGTVTSGGASFASSGNTLTVTNTANAIINWQSFSIGVNEITRFLQSSASSAVLNRVVGAGGAIPQSVIDGILSSNGRVFLLNSSGIVIGANARIDVAGFVASSLNLSDQDFLSGNLHFAAVPGAGGVSNAGVIQAASGGRVFLVAPDVENSGSISAPQGQIVLAAGKSVDLVSESSPFVTVRVTADTERALNLGSLIADSGRIDMSGALVRQSGAVSANSAVVGANGEIRLVATNSVTLDSGSVTSASGGAHGGSIQVSAPVVTQVGDVRADGNAGGKIQIAATNFLQAGTLSASGSAGAGGEIGVSAPHIIQTSAAVVAADGSGGVGGSISVDASGALDGLLFSSAKYSATGTQGGNIKLLGHDIVLLGASADASGTNGGGTILVGGDFHGSNPAVPNATTTGINFSTTLKADATQNGDGGKIVVWSDSDTRFYGAASARGGAQSGNGGRMEISSGGDHLAMFGFADAGAPNGTPGTLLLDPHNIVIDSNTGGSGALGSFQLVDPHPGANEQFGREVVVLPNQNVVVTDPNDSFVAINAGAVYLFNSTSGALISALTGSSPNDHVGANNNAITTLLSGNFVVASPDWNNGAATLAGAVTLVSGTNGLSGTVSATNSLVGTTAGDQVGSSGVTQVGNGNFVVSSPAWSNAGAASAGAVTFVNGTTGLVGAVSAANSLVGTTANDLVGNFVTSLSNGNYVVSSPNWTNPQTQAGLAGAVTFGSGTTGVAGAVSATNSLVGTTANDRVGFFGVTELSSGNYLVSSPEWNNGAATLAGAVTFVNGSNGNIAATGAPGGAVSAANSLVGTTINDQVGLLGVIVLANGNYLVSSPNWNNGAATLAGAVTFGNGTAGVSGAISTANSLVGTTANDHVGGVTLLTNGNYVVSTPNWTNPQTQAPSVGAVTFGNGATGVVGTISTTNSLVGTTANDRVGTFVTPLINGNYVVSSPLWDQPAGAAPGPADIGAVTFGSATAGVIGAVSAANSLVGTTANDQVGLIVTPLFNGNYVVNSPQWNNGAATLAGAVTFGNGTSGVVGAVSAANSLVGTTLNDQVGSNGITQLTNGNYVVSSPTWNNGAATLAGAVTFASGTSGIAGAVSATNSLVGTTAADQVGSFGVTPLFNGNYVVNSPQWNNGAATSAGAVTFGNGTTGVAGTVSAVNSLVGTTAGDQIGLFDVVPLLNGNYVVVSPNWNNGAATLAGAVTFGNGTTGVAGAVSAANSLVGTTANDQVGSRFVTPLFVSGNYVVNSPDWNGGRGAVTFGSGTTGVTGPVSSSNSLVGSTPDNPTAQTSGDHVGSDFVLQLPGGNYLVVSSEWNNSTSGATRAGAVTWVNGTNGNVFGQASPGAVVSASNSLVGGTSNDQVGGSNSCECTTFFLLPSGNFVLRNLNWTNPVTGAGNAGAVTVGSSTTGIAGLISSANSIVGSSPNDQIGSGGIFPLINGSFVVSSPNAANGALLGAGLVHVVTPGTSGTVSAPATGQTFASNPGSDVTITPATITAITNTGTAVVLQANNDITLNPGSDIVTSAGGAGGALTLQAGRSIVLDSSIVTDNGNLTLVANETAANGAITANRDTGAAVITQAAGTSLNAGSGAISITLSTGADANGTPAASGDITLANVATSGSLSVQNNGLTPGSSVRASGTLKAASMDLSAATGALGAAAAPLELAVGSLKANALSGIYINTNGASPAMVTVNKMTNGSTGDIVMNAHGGATFTSLVNNPGGNVSITTFSPLDVNAGISAGNSIFLRTSGTPTPGANDMFLNGPFTHGTNGVFEVTVGPRGQLTLPISTKPTVLTSSAFPNDPNITKFTFVPSDPDPSFSQGIVTGTNQSTTFDSARGDSGGSDKKDKDEKKSVAVCK